MRPLRKTGLLAIAALAWGLGAGFFSYPGVQEEFGEKRYIRRIAKLRVPVIPSRCTETRGIENQDFIREDKNPDTCWIDLPTYRRLYPEAAVTTDDAGVNPAACSGHLPVEKWDGSPAIPLAGALALPLGPLIGLVLWLGFRGNARSRNH